MTLGGTLGEVTTLGDVATNVNVVSFSELTPKAGDDGAMTRIGGKKNRLDHAGPIDLKESSRISRAFFRASPFGLLENFTLGTAQKSDVTRLFAVSICNNFE